MKYIELRTRSAFSFLEGSALPEDLVERAAELGYPALAMICFLGAATGGLWLVLHTLWQDYKSKRNIRK